MPQPDESSRGSVANLIGRFETHTKRNSLSGSISASSRSSSVVSQTSTNGDSAAAEIRDKREWPPKNVAQTQQEPKPAFAMPSYLRPSVGHLASTVSSSLASANSGAAGGPGKSAPSSPPTTSENNGSPASLIQSAAADNQPTPPASVSRTSSRATLNSEQTIKVPVKPVDTSASEPSPAPEDVDPGTPKVGSISRKASTLTITPADVQPSGKTPVTAKPPPTAKAATASASKTPAATRGTAKAPAAATTKAPAKAPAAATPRTPAKATSTPKTPAKASVASSKTLTPASSMPTLRPQHTGQSATSGSASGSTRRVVSRTPVPSTPSRAKTPSKATSSNAKSPAVPRAKTPSTGLYAPTAASLARSRTAADAPPVPPPVKKVLSSEAADRLLRPTAASLSKARAAAAPVASSPRPSGAGGTPVKKAATPSGTPAKATPGTPSKGGVKKTSPLSPQDKKGKAASGAPSGEAVVAAGAAAVVTAAVAAAAAEEEVQTKEGEDEEPAAADPEPVDDSVEEPVVPETPAEAETSEEAEEKTNGHAVDEEVETKVEEEEEEVKEDAPEEPAGEAKPAGNDLEDLVNMLEFKPVSASADGAAAISDIPDEE
ncbi:hypothetical protein BKA70DRAFT_226520 [Coprinopsis sp. MPI-PUGE-AT-0042]|nr:hypothetical protein BKA70DRAFT_226520 [Coprinopsis sp. MPI-PUGE-AT-0042]